MCENDYNTLIQVYECLLHILSFLYHRLFYDKNDFCTILVSHPGKMGGDRNNVIQFYSRKIQDSLFLNTL